MLVKDTVRHGLMTASNAAAIAPATRRIWVTTLGRRTLNSVVRAGMIFIHIPKTGGTSICACLYGRSLPHYTRSFYNAAYGEQITALPSFSIVRDPVARLQSAYRFILAGGTDLMATSRFERARIPHLQSFAAFVAHLVEHPRTIDRVLPLRRQCDYIVDAVGRLQVDRVFLIDADGNLPIALADHLGVGSLPHLNASQGQREPVSALLRASIAALYADDFKLINRVQENDRGLP